MEIPIVGQAFAGRPADYFPVDKVREIRPIPGSRPGQDLAGIYICGDSLSGANIVDGDIAIFLKTDRVKEGQLALVATPHGHTIKFVYFKDDQIILRSANPNFSDVVWNVEDCRICGIVKRIERDL